MRPWRWCWLLLDEVGVAAIVLPIVDYGSSDDHPGGLACVVGTALLSSDRWRPTNVSRRLHPQAFCTQYPLRVGERRVTGRER